MVPGLRPIQFRHALGVFCAVFLLCGCAMHQFGLPVLSLSIDGPGRLVLWTEPFDQLDTSRWREVEVKGQTHYAIVDLDGQRCLRADSQGGASIMLSGLRFDPDKHEWLSWQWRVDQLVEGEALERKDGSDAAARVYVYFDTGGLPWQRKNIDYVWSATLPVGTILSSAYSSTSKIIVVESGTEHLGQWRMVTRNIEDDFEEVFGGDVPDVVAIGLMSDTDNTGAKALAYFDELRIGRSRPQTTSKDGSR